jgi:hypothetical protein
MLFDINQSGKFGTHFFIQFSDLFDQRLGLLSVFLLSSLDELLTQIDNLAIGLGLSLVAANDADEISARPASRPRALLPKHAPPMLLAHFVGDAGAWYA